MSWSYDPTDLGKHLNWIRLRVGDTDGNDQQISDEEINGILALEAQREEAAAQVAERIAAQYARFGAPAAEADRYRELAARIRQETGPGYL